MKIDRNDLENRLFTLISNMENIPKIENTPYLRHDSDLWYQDEVEDDVRGYVRKTYPDYYEIKVDFKFFMNAKTYPFPYVRIIVHADDEKHEFNIPLMFSNVKDHISVLVEDNNLNNSMFVNCCSFVFSALSREMEHMEKTCPLIDSIRLKHNFKMQKMKTVLRKPFRIILEIKGKKYIQNYMLTRNSPSLEDTTSFKYIVSVLKDHIQSEKDVYDKIREPSMYYHIFKGRYPSDENRKLMDLAEECIKSPMGLWNTPTPENVTFWKRVKSWFRFK